MEIKFGFLPRENTHRRVKIKLNESKIIIIDKLSPIMEMEAMVKREWMEKMVKKDKNLYPGWR